ncbi:ATP-grasp domain-containing protein [Nostoc sp. LEGE 12450]|uniref:ATP-grasp domain-containing protein n=1 Tax=Nostoc sp. LEGE 12450 TaxID=1828643 RepID=UPI001880FB4C|nr:ATP-grasp domain-containing protein [Nostoc sp. LEGE 12450]MBE8985967.1 ATP-grasp domain-containing protein [Nostoc sp. LEGE 12450]
MGKESNEKNVLCIGAGIEQLPTIQIAQKMGLKVIALDENSNAVGLQVADRGIVMDLRNTVKVIQLARELNIRCVLPVPLGAILTTVGVVNDALGLKGISEAAAKLCTDKLLTRQILAEAGLPTPKFAEATDDESLLKAAEKIGYPVVVKPRYGSGSQGVFVARDKAEFLRWLPWHLEQRQKYKEAEQSLIESFVIGEEVGVDSIVISENHSIILIRDKEVTQLPFRLPFGYLAPTQVPVVIQKSIDEKLAKACMALGLKNCLIHADIIISDSGEIVILDISGRPSGFNISAKMIPVVTGVEPIYQAIQLSLGYKTDFCSSYHQGAILRMLSAPTGYFLAIEGIEEVRQMSGVVDVESFLEPGEMIQESRTGATGYRVGYLLTSGKTRDEADLIWHKVANKIHFHMENNQ